LARNTFKRLAVASGKVVATTFGLLPPKQLAPISLQNVWAKRSYPVTSSWTFWATAQCPLDGRTPRTRLFKGYHPDLHHETEVRDSMSAQSS
jgi:hypothetical protein